MLTNEIFHLFANGQVYSSGPTYDVAPHLDAEGSWDSPPTSGVRGRRVGTVSSIPEFVEELRSRPDILLEWCDPKLMPRQPRRPVARGRRWVWVRWLSKDDGQMYVLKSDRSIRRANHFTVAGHIPETTDVRDFINRLRTEGHTITFIHQRFKNASP